jgi:uncharacterized protein (DUF362 family)
MAEPLNVAIARAGSYDADVVRDALLSALRHLGADAGNPLGSIVRPGDTVFIKPNWVSHEYRKSAGRDEDVYSTITHPSVIRAVADLAARALAGRGRLIVGDNPSIDADFAKLRELAALDDLQGRYDVPCQILDLRPLRCADLKDYGIRDRMTPQPGDPRGSVLVDLGARSMLHAVNPRRFRGVFTDRSETVARHTGSKQEYEFSASLFNADVYISIPKLKTHHKVGTTLNLKGLVGTVHNKNLLVHWRTGFPAVGGDEYPSFAAWARGQFASVKKRGAWRGNDTIWRMVVDLYHAFGSRPRRTLSVVDGIRGGEGDGPFCPVSRDGRVLVVGEDLLAVDCVASRLMGFDIDEIPYLRHLVQAGPWTLDDIDVRAPWRPPIEGFFRSPDPYLRFAPPTNWQNLIEWQRRERRAYEPCLAN